MEDCKIAYKKSLNIELFLYVYLFENANILVYNMN